MFLDKELKALEAFFPHIEAQRNAVSKKGVGWHIDHSLKVIIGIADALKTSDPSEYRWAFNFLRFLVYMRGTIPRGRGKAPESVQSFETIVMEDLIFQLKAAKTALSDLHTLAPKSHFRHPYFGVLHLKQTQRFLEIHTRHHLKIIEEILG